MYGLSNWSAEKFALIRKEYPFFALFDGIVLSGQVKLAKPDPRIFQLLLDRAGCTAGECLFIDDSETNIKAARALGFQTIQYQSSVQLASELEQLGIRVGEDGGAGADD